VDADRLVVGIAAVFAGITTLLTISSEGVVAASIGLEMPPVDQVVLRDLDQDDVQQITDRLDTLVGEVIEHHDTRMD
jgi:hypothetical protein